MHSEAGLDAWRPQLRDYYRKSIPNGHYPTCGHTLLSAALISIIQSETRSSVSHISLRLNAKADKNWR